MIRTDAFYFNFQEKQIIPNYVSELSLAHNGHVLFKGREDKTVKKYHAYNLGLFPSYLDFKAFSEDEYRRKTIMDKKDYGCAVSLENHEDIETYVSSHFRKNGNFRNKIRKNIRRLEGCFDIRYEMFFGKMKRSDYDFIMSSLHSMILNRFSQINDTNFAISKWERIYNQGYEWICTNKASLFVIFDNGIPINISLNYHFDKIFFGAVSSYNTDYSKFALGHIMIYKVLDWCFENKYQLLDMAHGNLQYKQMWCNLIYSYENHIVYNKNKLLGIISGKILQVQVATINFIKALRQRILLRKKMRVQKKPNSKVKASGSTVLNQKYKLIEILDSDINDFGNEIALTDQKHEHLRRPVYDFLYLHEKSLQDVKLFKTDVVPPEYYIKANKTAAVKFFHPAG